MDHVAGLEGGDEEEGRDDGCMGCVLGGGERAEERRKGGGEWVLVDHVARLEGGKGGKGGKGEGQEGGGKGGE